MNGSVAIVPTVENRGPKRPIQMLPDAVPERASGEGR
jgi:hypothetical protein